MGKSITKVVYKPDPQSTDEYIVIVEPEAYKKYKAGDKTIPLTDVVESFTVYFSNQGHQGFLGQPSKQQLDNDFGTHVNVEVIELMIQKGKDQTGDTIQTSPFGSTNITRGSVVEHRGGNAR